MKYRAEIDGLRALAVIPVILFHAGFELFSGGFVGVDVFFVISGYLITTIIINELEVGTFSIVNFYERRAKRILPALFAVVALCIPLAWLWLMPQDQKDFGQSLLAVATFSSNILFWLESGYFDTAAELKPLLHTWSLAVEEQYYIFFPLLLMFAWRWGRRSILVILVGLFICSLALAQWGAYNSPTAAFYLLPMRGWELLIGAFAAFYLQRQPIQQVHVLHNVLSVIGLAMVIFSIVAYSKLTPFPGFYALLPTVGTVLIILFAVERTVVNRLLRLRPMVVVGLISYSAYLWHQPIFAFARHRSLHEPSATLMLVLATLSLVLAYATWRWIENPFRRRHAFFNRRRIFTGSAVGLGCLLTVGVAGQMVDTRPMSQVAFGDQSIEIPSKFTGIQQDGRNCSTPTFNVDHEPCILDGENRSGPIVIIIGDSHSRVLSEALFEQPGEFSSLIDLSASGCPFLPGLSVFRGTDSSDCNAEYQALRMDYMNGLDGDLLFVMSARLPWYYHKTQYNNGAGGLEAGPPVFAATNLADNEIVRHEAFKRSLTEAVGFLQSKGRVVIVQPTHTNAWNVPARAVRLSNLNMSYEDAVEALSVSQRAVNHWQQPIESILKNFASTNKNVSLVDPKRLTCDSKSALCFALKDGDMLFSDADHLAVGTNRKIAEQIFTAARQASRSGEQ